MTPKQLRDAANTPWEGEGTFACVRGAHGGCYDKSKCCEAGECLDALNRPCGKCGAPRYEPCIYLDTWHDR